MTNPKTSKTTLWFPADTSEQIYRHCYWTVTRTGQLFQEVFQGWWSAEVLPARVFGYDPKTRVSVTKEPGQHWPPIYKLPKGNWTSETYAKTGTVRSTCRLPVDLMGQLKGHAWHTSTAMSVVMLDAWSWYYEREIFPKQIQGRPNESGRPIVKLAMQGWPPAP